MDLTLQLKGLILIVPKLRSRYYWYGWASCDHLTRSHDQTLGWWWSCSCQGNGWWTWHCNYQYYCEVSKTFMIVMISSSDHLDTFPTAVTGYNRIVLIWSTSICRSFYRMMCLNNCLFFSYNNSIVSLYSLLINGVSNAVAYLYPRASMIACFLNILSI